MEFIEIQRNLVTTLLKIPAMEQMSGRTSLLDGLPDAGLVRDQSIARLDLNRMIGGLEKLGRLTKEGGTRPVIVVVENALGYVPEQSAVADELVKLRQELAVYYGGDAQPAPTQPPTKETLEALIFGLQRDTRLPFSYIQKAETTARSVARLTVPRIFDGVATGEVGYGTGWIIAPGLLLTNHHVVDARDYRTEEPAKRSDLEAQASEITARFDYFVEKEGSESLECEKATLLASNQAFDYALIELAQADKVADRAQLALIPKQPKLTRGARMNIVQHPQGGPLQYGIRNNFFVRNADKEGFLLYQTDTEPGASGSPVLNDNWQVVGLHHASQRVPSEMVPQEVVSGKPVEVTVLNEAIEIHDVLNDMPAAVKTRILQAQGIK